MKELSFDTGRVSYCLNGAVEVSFNPTDFAFVEKLFSTFNALDAKQEAYDGEKGRTADSRKIFDLAREADGEMRAMIDGMLGQPVCEALFGGMNVYAFADGLPVWCNLMLALMDEVDTSFAREQKATNPRIQKYTAKYRR